MARQADIESLPYLVFLSVDVPVFIRSFLAAVLPFDPPYDLPSFLYNPPDRHGGEYVLREFPNRSFFSV